MAIVTVNSNIYGATGVNGYTAPNSSSLLGVTRTIQGTVANAATDNTGSRYPLFRIPWSAILLPATSFHTASWGFAQAVIGTLEDPDGLLDAAKGAAAGGQLPITIFASLWNKPFWQQMGLAAMPTSPFAEVAAVAEADATGAGTLNFFVQYANHV
jgi:hypothetical protein